MQNEARRSEIAWELSEFFVNSLGEKELDEQGVVLFDFREQLIQIAASEEPTYDFITLLSENQPMLERVKVDDIPITDVVND